MQDSYQEFQEFSHSVVKSNKVWEKLLYIFFIKGVELLVSVHRFKKVFLLVLKSITDSKNCLGFFEHVFYCKHKALFMNFRMNFYSWNDLRNDEHMNHKWKGMTFTPRMRN